MSGARAVYAALDEAGAVKQHRSVTYRCRARGCVLLDVLRVPAGLLLVWPDRRVGWRLRERHAVPMQPGAPTVKWAADAWPLGRSVALVGCGHVTASLTRQRVEGDVRRGHGSVVVLPDDGDRNNALQPGPFRGMG